MASLLGRQLKELDARIKEIDVKLAAAHQANEVSPRLATIPGVGPAPARKSAIIRGERFADEPDMTPEEHKRRGDGADAMFQEMKRRIAGKERP